MDDKVKELYYMCRDNNFAIARANELIGEIDVNEPIHDDPDREQHITTFLSEACSNTNLKMAKLLLEHGADPNYVLYTDKPGWQENPFWDLQYPVYDDEFYNENDENKKIANAADTDNLEIARLCLEHGANPCIKLDDDDDLFSWVFYAVVEDEDYFRLLEYRSKFLILLIAYGGKNKYYEYEIIKPFDKNNMNQYDFVRFGSNPYSVDEIVDEHYEVVARIRHRKENTDE